MKFEEEAKKLKTSHWPACDALATGLAIYGKEASDALASATTSRTHHVRSAALKALATINQERALTVAEQLLSDRAYEVRETAESVIRDAKKA